MELKKFEAPTLAEALQVIKRELGPEAVILSTKNKKSSLGLMNRTSVEVTAAIAPEALERKRLAESRLSSDERDDLQSRPAQKVIKAYDVLSGSRLNREMREQQPPGRAWGNGDDRAWLGGGAPQARRAQAPAPAQARPPADAGLTQRRYIDIRDDDSPAEQATQRAVDRTQLHAPSHAQFGSQLGQHLQGHLQHNPGLVQQRAPAAPSQQAAAIASAMNGVSVPGILQKMISQMVEAAIEPDLLRELSDELKMTMLREHITREDLLRMRFARILMSRLRVARPLGERLRIPTNPRVISFVGPTGVGKTTTIAKIAAEIVINQKRPVTLATTDTFKIAAVEQLQTYANILKVPLEVCPNAESLAQIGAHLGPDEVVLVDTAGYGPKDERRLSELREVLTAVRAETHLCVAATTRDSDLRAIVQRFRSFEPDYLVVTKLDETSIFGNIFNICARSHLPLSYFTMGQRVPEDIEIATRERVADLILNIAGGDETWTRQTV